jgi:hypothetical protein
VGRRGRRLANSWRARARRQELRRPHSGGYWIAHRAKRPGKTKDAIQGGINAAVSGRDSSGRIFGSFLGGSGDILIKVRADVAMPSRAWASKAIARRYRRLGRPASRRACKPPRSRRRRPHRISRRRHRVPSRRHRRRVTSKLVNRSTIHGHQRGGGSNGERLVAFLQTSSDLPRPTPPRPRRTRPTAENLNMPRATHDQCRYRAATRGSRQRLKRVRQAYNGRIRPETARPSISDAAVKATIGRPYKRAQQASGRGGDGRGEDHRRTV